MRQERLQVRDYLTGLLQTGHRHIEFKQMLLCSTCGTKAKKAEEVWKRLKFEKREVFNFKKPEEKFDRETENLGDMLTERIKNDSLYKNHLKKLAFGTPEEKAKEMVRMKSGFYEKYTG